MLSFYNIWTVAKFEIKTLSRSWFLRIFALLSIILLFLFNLMMFTDLTGGFIPRFFYAMSASIPYANLMMLNLAQAIIAIFLASDFLKRDKKLDTTEAIYIRSITNSDYVLGKSIGILIIFIVLNLIVLLMAAVFNIINPDTIFSISVYFYYLVLMSLPTLIFIIGLSFLVMTLIPNQAVTFILLLGYVATTLFYLGWNYYQVLDYIAFFVPMLHSDFVGFGNLSDLLLLRGAYVLLGLGLICITMYKFKRLPQSDSTRHISLVFAGIFILAGLLSMYLYISDVFNGRALRHEMVTVNNRYIDKHDITIISNNLTIDHKGNSLSCISELELANNSGSDMNNFILSLNPGLKINKLTSAEEEIDYTRESHLIIIKPESPLKQGAKINLAINYSGSIIDESAYLDINNDKRSDLVKLFYTVDKKYSFVSPEYVLLTSENLWYPQSGITYTPDAQFNNPVSFTMFNLTVNTSPGLTVISQGSEPDTIKQGSFKFTPAKPMPKLSLSIGKYFKRRISIDSVDYNLFTYKNHDYFEQYFNEIGDTLSALIVELKQDYERELGLNYPYTSLSLVETPVQFTSYERIWTSANEFVQPQIVYLPENGFGMDEADFKRSKNMYERFGNRSNQVILPRESQSNMFKRFARNTFTLGSGDFRFRGSPNANNSLSNPFKLFPNYYNFVNYISSPSLPVFNKILGDYLNVKNSNATPFMRAIMGLSSEERAVQQLYEKPLEEIIADTTNNRYIKDIIRLKGEYLFTSLENQIGYENLHQLIRDILHNNRYTDYGFNSFKSGLNEKYKINFESLISEWFSSSNLPAYYITKVEGYKIIDEDRERYQVNFNITNPESVDGFVRISFEVRRGGQSGRFGRMFGGDEEETPLAEKLIHIGPNQSKRISSILDDSPGRLSINTIISRNLPLNQDLVFDELVENKKTEPFDGEKILEEMEPFNIPGEIVVDNEDDGFQIFNPEQTSFLKRLFNLGQDDEKYIGLRRWNAPENWRATVVSEAYGKFIHSAHFTEAGDGSIKVAWNYLFEESGYYDIYTYLPKPRIPGRRRESNEEYYYNVYSDDGEEEVVIDYDNADEGWNLLGSFYISADSSKVELTNKSDNGLIIADAVKWVKRK